MARVFVAPADRNARDHEGQPLSQLDVRSRAALTRFYAYCAGAIVLSVIFFFVASRLIIPDNLLFAALLSGVLAVALLFLMAYQLRQVRLLDEDEAVVDGLIRRALAQLDDRFAVFLQLRADDTVCDYLVIGPTGIFAIHVASGKFPASSPPTGALRDCERMTEALVAIFDGMFPDSALDVEALLCCAGAGEADHIQRVEAVWVVPAPKLVSAMLKRSGLVDSVTEGVMDTGAINVAVVRIAELEHRLAAEYGFEALPTQWEYDPQSAPRR